MNMIRLDIDFFDGYLFFLGTELIDSVSERCFGFAFEYLVSVFRTEYNMVCTQPHCVRETFVF